MSATKERLHGILLEGNKGPVLGWISSGVSSKHPFGGFSQGKGQRPSLYLPFYRAPQRSQAYWMGRSLMCLIVPQSNARGGWYPAWLRKYQMSVLPAVRSSAGWQRPGTGGPRQVLGGRAETISQQWGSESVFTSLFMLVRKFGIYPDS